MGEKSHNCGSKKCYHKIKRKAGSEKKLATHEKAIQRKQKNKTGKGDAQFIMDLF